MYGRHPTQLTATKLSGDKHLGHTPGSLAVRANNPLVTAVTVTLTGLC